MSNTYQPFSVQQPWKHWEYVIWLIRIVDEVLSILKGLLHLLQDYFSVSDVAHQGYDLFTTLLIQLTTSLRQLPLLSWTATSCCMHFWFLEWKFCVPLNGLEPPCQKSSATLAVIEMFLTKDRQKLVKNKNHKSDRILPPRYEKNKGEKKTKGNEQICQNIELSL